MHSFQNSQLGYTLHVFPGMNKAHSFENGGKGWHHRPLDMEQKCYHLDDAAEDGGEILDNANKSRGGPQWQGIAEGESTQAGLNTEAERGCAEQSAEEEGKGQVELNRRIGPGQWST